jgi:hypothetical protein
MKRSAGRPKGSTKLTPDLQERIVQFVRSGNYVETAAAAAGIHKDTLYDWLKQGAAEESGKFRDFSDALQKATAVSETNAVQLITDAAETQWQAAAWRLERKSHERWGRKERLEHTGQGGKLGDEKLDELERILREAAGELSPSDAAGDSSGEG